MRPGRQLPSLAIATAVSGCLQRTLWLAIIGNLSSPRTGNSGRYGLNAVTKDEALTYPASASRSKDGKNRMTKAAAKKMKQRSAGKPDIELGKRIRLRRVEQKISQAELGDKLGVSFQQVQKYEKGVNRVGAARLQQIATALDVPVTFFYDGDGKAREVESLLFLDSSFSLRLLRAYSKIKDQTVQRQLVSLMESIAANEA